MKMIIKYLILLNLIYTYTAQHEIHKKLEIGVIPVVPPFKVGFGGFSDVRAKSVYFVDHYSNYCYRYSLIDNKIYRAAVETNFTISFIIPSKESPNVFFVGAGNTIILVAWDGRTDRAKFIKLVCEVEPNTGNIMNHAAVGPRGELIFGTFSLKLCSSNAEQGVYQYTANKSQKVVTLLTGVKITSGLVVNDNLLYHLDGCKQELTVFDRNYQTGRLTNRRLVIKFNFPTDVLTVGLAIDSAGFLCTGLYGSSFLVRICPKTRTYDLIRMPTEFISDPGFGGLHNDVLYVATGTVIPDFLTGQPNRTIDTPKAGSVLTVKGLGYGISPVRLPVAGKIQDD